MADAARLLQEGPGFVWLAVSEPDPEQLNMIGAVFDLPPLAIEQAMAGHPRPKLEVYEGCALVVVKTAVAEESTMQPTVGEPHIFLALRYVVVVGRAATDALAGARQRIDEHPEIAALGPMSVLWAALDAVIADGERVADLLIDEGVDIEQGVFGGDHDQSQPIYEHERRVEQVARVVHPVLRRSSTHSSVASASKRPIACVPS